MRKTIYFGLLIFTISCSNSIKDLNEQLVIAGKIDNPKNTLIEINSSEYSGLNKFTTTIEENGEFYTSIPVNHYHDISLIIDDNWITLLNQPGDSVYIEIYSSDSIKYSGNNAKTNSDVNKLLEKFGNAYRSAAFWDKKSELNPIDFKMFTQKFCTKTGLLLDSVSKSINATNDAYTYIQAKLLYECTDNLFEYGKHNKEKIDSNYYDFISDYKFTHGDANICSDYYSEYVIHYFFFKIDSDPDYNSLKKGKGKEGIVSYLKLVEKKGSNEVSDILVTRFLSQLSLSEPTYADSLYKQFGHILSNEFLKTKIQIAIDKSLQKDNNIKSLSQLAQYDIVGDLFSDLKDNNSDKVLYLDFWGTWCKWCIKEFPNSSKLHNDLINKDIEFVYLCSPTDSVDWKNTIEKYNVQGKNILLTKDQYTKIQSIFNFSGLPRYMIVDKNGRIIDEDAERPSSEIIKQRLIELSAI